MKLLKAYTIFTSRKYRLLMGGFLVLLLAVNTAVALLGYVTKTTVSLLVLSFVGMVPLYGDISVFAGLHNKEGGQIAACQASFYGEKTMLLGVAADRVHIYLWLLVCGIITFVTGIAFTPASIWSLLTGWGVLAALETLSVMINRFFLTTQAHMFAIVLEGGITGAVVVVFWVLFPIGNWISALFSVMVAIAMIFVEIKLAGHFMKRSYYDE